LEDEAAKFTKTVQDVSKNSFRKRVEAQKQRLTRGSKDGEATYYKNAQKDVEMDNTIEYRNLLTTHTRAEQYSLVEFESYAFLSVTLRFMAKDTLSDRESEIIYTAQVRIVDRGGIVD